MPTNTSDLGITWRLIPEETVTAYYTNNTFSYENSNYYFSLSKKEENIQKTIMDIE